MTILELAAGALSKIPAPEAALRLRNRELLRYCRAAGTMSGWLVGHSATASAEEPEPGSALGKDRRISRWTQAELDRNFFAALEDLHAGKVSERLADPPR